MTPPRARASTFPRAALGHSTISGSDWLLATLHFVWPAGAKLGGVARWLARLPEPQAVSATGARRARKALRVIIRALLTPQTLGCSAIQTGDACGPPRRRCMQRASGCSPRDLHAPKPGIRAFGGSQMRHHGCRAAIRGPRCVAPPNGADSVAQWNA